MHLATFIPSFTYSLTHLLIQIIFCGDFHGSRQYQKGAREKEEEEQIEKAREATERTPDLRFEILPLCTMEIRAHAQIGSL